MTQFPVSDPPPFGVAPPVESKRVLAGVLGIVLGALGIHKFVLGYTTAGIIMLLVSIIGGVLTYGLAASAMHIIGLVEGIMYLTKSDADFIRTYQQGKKEWF